MTLVFHYMQHHQQHQEEGREDWRRTPAPLAAWV